MGPLVEGNCKARTVRNEAEARLSQRGYESSVEASLMIGWWL